MNTEGKPRSDSKLKTLPEERQCEIFEYARTHTLAETVDWLRANGVDTSSAALSPFLHWYRIRSQMTASEQTIQQMLEKVATQNPDITPERIYQLGQVFFAGLALAKQDPQAWCITQRTALSRARLDLAIKKYQEAKQAQDASQAPGGLTPETVTKIENELHLR
jgi:hypothetical protein